MTADRKPVSFLGKRPHPAFEKRVISVAPGDRRAYDEAEWWDALVVVERGEIDLESPAGGRRRFASGALLYLTGLPVRGLHNPGKENAVLIAVSRRRAPDD